MAKLIKKRTILEAGLTNARDTSQVISFENMQLNVSAKEVDPSRVIIPTLQDVTDIISTSVIGTHKSIAGEYEVVDVAGATAAFDQYNTGADLIFTNGRIFNKLNASPGEVFFIVPGTAGSTYKAEEVIVGANKELILLSNENDIFADLDVINTNINKNIADISLKENTADVDSKLLTESTERKAEDARLSGLIKINQDDIAANLVDSEKKFTQVDTQVAINKDNSDDYINNKADFVRLEDITSSIQIKLLTPLSFALDGDDVVCDLTPLTAGEIAILNNFADDRLITIEATPNIVGSFPVQYARDGWNNANGSANILLGRHITVITKWTADAITPVVREIRVQGLTDPDRSNFIRDFKITELSQISGSTGINVDLVARQQASTAQSTANTALATANATGVDVTDLTRIIANKQDKVDNNLVDGISVSSTKSIVGAINSLHNRVLQNETDLNQIDTTTLAALELKLGV